MGSPAIFAGRRTKLLTADGVLLRNGMVLDSDGLRNYIFNGHAEVSASGWATYADAAGVSPVDGTGGAANVTLTRTTSSPLRGQASLLFTKDAVNRQGQGASYDFTIDDADKAKVLQIEMDYEIASGTYATGDLALYIVDVTNATVIQPAGYQIENVGIESRIVATFQTAANSTSYRLCVHVASTSASAYTVKLDNVRVGPQVTTQGVIITDWVSYTPTGSWTSNTTYSGLWRRVGDQMQVSGNIAVSGAPSPNTNLLFSLPSGYSIDTSKLEITSLKILGQGVLRDNGTDDTSIMVEYWTTTQVGFRKYQGSSLSPTSPITFAANDSLNFIFSVPIAGWSSSNFVSSSANNRVVAFRIRGEPTGTPAGSPTIVNWGSADLDTVGGWDGTDEYTVRVPGLYYITAHVDVNGTGITGAQLDIEVDGADVSINAPLIPSAGRITARASALVQLNAGQKISTVFSSNGTGISWLSGCGDFSIFMLSGPSQVAASEIVAARYTSNDGDSYNNNVVIDFEERDYDTHNAVTTGASWRFTAPVAGIYRVAAAFQSNASADTVGDSCGLAIYKNNVLYAELGRERVETTNSTAKRFSGGTSVGMSAGDYIEIRMINGLSTGAIALQASSANVWVVIEKVGGV